MADFKMNGIGFTAPDDYQARMIVIAAPQKAGPAMPGQMAIKQESKFARNVVVASEDLPEAMDLKEYAEKQIGILKASMPGFQVLKQGEIEIGGKTCPMFEAQSAGPDGRLLNSMTCYVIKDRTAFTLSASHLAGLPFSDTKKEYAKIIQSFFAG
jgi:hypothetical protein